MATYLFTWNPARWDWTYLQESIAKVKKNGYVAESWSCGITKKISPGDRAFLIKLGEEPRGIVASGWVTSNFREGKHWDKEASARGKTALYVDVQWDTILDPDRDIFPRIWLESDIYSKMHWEPQASGVRIPDDIAKQLEKDWAKFTSQSIPITTGALATQVDFTTKNQPVSVTGAGFGTAENNRKVEQAAIEATKKYYVSRGWKVESVEADKLGFDLRCIKGPKVEHVEVKGISGEVESFIITAREVKQAKIDHHFVLCVVRSAVSKEPRVSRYTASSFAESFKLTPLAFQATKYE